MLSRFLSAAALTAGMALTTEAQDPQASVRWAGNFQPVQMRSSSVGIRIQSRIYGTAELASVPSNPSRSRVRLRFTAQTAGNQAFTAQWGLLPGRCGAGSLPVHAIENFPVIDVSSNGRAQLDDEVALSLPTSGEYHVNIYLGGQNLENVITCANLRKADG